MELFIVAFQLIFDPYVLLVIILSGAFGLFMGAIPGLSATMAVALLVPVTFFMPPVPALASIVTATAMAIFAGDLPGALLRIPGTPASASYTNEAFAMTRKGQAELVLGTGLVSAVLGGMFGAVVLSFTAPILAEFALKFSSFEYFWLASLGLTCAAFISTESLVKGLISLMIGLLIATIGIDVTTGHPRFTFGSVELMGGVNFIPAMIGMYAMAEVFRSVTAVKPLPRVKQRNIGNIFAGLGKVLYRYKVNLLRGSTIGVLVGALPGAGSDIAAWISYAVAKKFSREPEKFSTGHVEGIVEAGSSNNAGLGGTWVPALVFGIPGDSITAIVIGVLYVKGMNPGPTVFLEQPELIYAVFVSFFLANLLLLPLGLFAIKSAKQLLRVPREVLMPVILMFCVVGTFAINNTVFGVGIMLALGVISYFLEENGFPIAPVILGLVLGGLLEESFMTSMIKADGDLLAFFERPVSAVLGTITILIWLSPLLTRKSIALEQLSKQLAKYLSPQVYDSIFSGKQEVKLDSKRKRLTVFFSDIIDFTKTTERLESEDLTQLLNHYLTEMSEIALTHGATIDKYVGDAIVIFFGDPETRGVKQDAVACVTMAIAMRKRMKDLEKIWMESGLEKPLKCRIGINTGLCTVGNFGSEDRMDYTIIGSGVNLAARLEKACPPGEILISYETYAHIKDVIECQPVGQIEAKGFTEPVSTHRVIDLYENLDTEMQPIRADLTHVRLDIDVVSMTPEERQEAVTVLRDAIKRLTQLKDGYLDQGQS